MFKEVLKREDSAEKTDALRNLYDLIYHASHLNYSQGISNNPTVKQSLKEVGMLYQKFLLSNLTKKAENSLSQP